MTPSEFRRLALELPESAEGSHMGHADFRVGGKIFATLGYPDEGRAVVILPAEEQKALLEAGPVGTFVPAAGAWGRAGATQVRLAQAKRPLVEIALRSAWHKRAPKRLLDAARVAAARRGSRKNVQRILQTIGFAALLFATAACDKSRERIAGRWQVAGGGSPIVWEFAKNGAVKTGDTPGRYNFGGRDRLKIQTQSATFVYEVEFAGETMKWRDPNGTMTELKRLP